MVSRTSMIRIPQDASRNVQAAFEDTEKRLRELETKVFAAEDDDTSRNISALQKRVSELATIPTYLNPNDVFRPSGAAHAIGYVPDPGETAGTSRYLNENGTWTTPVAVYYYVTSVTKTAGTFTPSVDADIITAVSSIGGTYLDVQETNGSAPGWNFEFDFSSVESPNWLFIHAYYTGTHTASVQLWNFNTSAWVDFVTLPTSGTGFLPYTVAISADYLSGGVVKVRFYHAASGNQSHHVYVDYCVVQSGGFNPAAIDHNQLGGLDDPNSHPATAISNTPTNGLVSTNVQSAINELQASIESVCGLRYQGKNLDQNILCWSGDLAVTGAIQADSLQVRKLDNRFCGVRAHKSDNTSLSAATRYFVAMDVEDYDTDGFHSTTTNTTRFTIPTGLRGWYRITAIGRFAATASEHWRAADISINSNSTFTIGNLLATVTVEKGLSNTVQDIQAVATAYLNEGDYVECAFASEGATTLNALASYWPAPSFEMYRIGL